ncbi:monocarboxylate transporter 9-like [Lytechinus variegatus]|uniref:monocarboxylate transporter 9-like n=1 Tax=Lytechinus variegatus TaxID=7654 RepID=UPI001BB2CCAE|nr:monocarboxylate transporter 9-like [Lytechinus variegatus]
MVSDETSRRLIDASQASHSTSLRLSGETACTATPLYWEASVTSDRHCRDIVGMSQHAVSTTRRFCNHGPTAAGIAKSFGVLLHEMVVKLNSNYAIVGFICSLPCTLTYLASPLVSLILERVNDRLVASGGAILSATCLLICAFSTNVVVVGVGLALTERSQEAYGYHGSFLILAGIGFHVIVCAVVIRKPIKSHCPEAKTMGLVQTDSEMTSKLIRPKNNNALGSMGEDIPSQEHQSSSTGVDHSAIWLDDVDVGVTTEHSPLITEKDDDELTGASAGTSKDITEPWYKFCCRGLTFYDWLVLLNMPSFYIFSYAMYGWLLFLVPHAESLGIISSHAVFLSSLAGIGGILGKTVFIILISKRVNPFLIYIPVSIVCSLTFLLDFVGSGYPVRASLAFIQGICFFTEDTMPFAVVKKITFDPVKFRRASAMLFFFTGLGSTSAGYITGFLFDITQSYTKVFMFIGVLHIVSLVILITTVILLRTHSPRITTEGNK